MIGSVLIECAVPIGAVGANITGTERRSAFNCPSSQVAVLKVMIGHMRVIRRSDGIVDGMEIVHINVTPAACRVVYNFEMKRFLGWNGPEYPAVFFTARSRCSVK